MKCSECGNELEHNAKFCTSCGSKQDTSNTSELSETPIKAYSFLMKIVYLLILIFVGFFVYTIIKVIISLVFMLLIKYNIVELDTYNSIKFMLPLLSIILAIFLTPKITDLKTMKARIILGLAIVVIGTAGAVWISTSNMKARSVQEKKAVSTYMDLTATQTYTTNQRDAAALAIINNRNTDLAGCKQYVKLVDSYKNENGKADPALYNACVYAIREITKHASTHTTPVEHTATTAIHTPAAPTTSITTDTADVNTLHLMCVQEMYDKISIGGSVSDAEIERCSSFGR